MRVPELRDWLRRQAGKAFCDVCIAARLGITRGRRGVWRGSKLIGSTGGFRREKGSCSVCGKPRLVIRAI